MVDPVQGAVYRHYKGGLYYVLAVAEHHDHDGKKDVVYLSLEHGKVVTRPLERDARNEDSWTDLVEWPDGIQRRRFIPYYTESALIERLASGQGFPRVAAAAAEHIKGKMEGTEG